MGVAVREQNTIVVTQVKPLDIPRWNIQLAANEIQKAEGFPPPFGYARSLRNRSMTLLKGPGLK